MFLIDIQASENSDSSKEDQIGLEARKPVFRVSKNQPAQLQRLARKINFHLWQV